MTKQEMVDEVNRKYDINLTVDTCWTTEELTSEYEVTGFMAPYMVATKRDSENTTKYVFAFTHMPRLYYGRTP